MELAYQNGRAVAENGDIGVTMLIQPSQATDAHGIAYRYFEYVASFTQPASRIEWDADTMQAVLPKADADFVVKRGYARDMTEAEIEIYNKAAEPPSPSTESPPEPQADVTQPESSTDAPADENKPDETPATKEPASDTQVRVSKPGKMEPPPRAASGKKRGDRQ